MIVEQRRYTLVPGGAVRYLQAWDAAGRAPQVLHLGEPLGVYTVEVGALNTLVYLWGYEDAHDRECRRAALAADQQFAEFRRTVRELVVSQHNEILSRHLTPVPVPTPTTET
jgi:hypothetical protein